MPARRQPLLKQPRQNGRVGSQLLKYRHVLDALRRVDDTTQVTLIEHSKKEIIDALVSIARTVIKPSTRLSPQQLHQVRRIARDISDLLRPGTNLGEKKRVLQRGGFVGALVRLIPTVLSLSRVLGGLGRL